MRLIYWVGKNNKQNAGKYIGEVFDKALKIQYDLHYKYNNTFVAAEL